MAPQPQPHPQETPADPDSPTDNPPASIGDEDAATDLQPTEQQLIMIYIICGYAVGIWILWNLPYISFLSPLRFLTYILYPFKLLTIALHEFGHAAAGVLTGAKITSIEVNPDEGGLTQMRGGIQFITLPAGYLGSSFFGALMIFSAFDVLASQIVSVIIGVCMLLTLYWAKNWLTRGLTILFIGLVALIWWATSGSGLRYFVAFVGTMSCLYSIWDVFDDLIRRKEPSSDASQFAKMCVCFPFSRAWGVIWMVVSVVFLVGSILVALLVW